MALFMWTAVVSHDSVLSYGQGVTVKALGHCTDAILGVMGPRRGLGVEG